MRDEEAVRQFVERTSRQLSDWGLPPMAARVLLTVMTAEEDALSAVELAERLGASAGAISGAVRYLTDSGVIRRDPVPGSRRDLYALTSETWWEATLIKGNRLQTIVETVDEGVAALGGPETRSGRAMADMRDYLAFWRDEIPLLLDKWYAQRAAQD
jgi:DNA-binding transcriptional regulator GbsR (MarR family)